MASIVFRTIAFAVVLIASGLGSASAQEQQSRQQAQPRNQPGRFDFYVLSLSWSPSFCKESEERGRPSNDQCRGRPYSFVVHGLWPQYERGFPRDCQVPAPRLSRELTTSLLDLMPAPGLIYQEWDQHGPCSGLAFAAAGYAARVGEMLLLGGAARSVRAVDAAQPADILPRHLSRRSNRRGAHLVDPAANAKP